MLRKILAYRQPGLVRESTAAGIGMISSRAPVSFETTYNWIVLLDGKNECAQNADDWVEVNVLEWDASFRAAPPSGHTPLEPAAP